MQQSQRGACHKKCSYKKAQRAASKSAAKAAAYRTLLKQGPNCVITVLFFILDNIPDSSAI